MIFHFKNTYEQKNTCAAGFSLMELLIVVAAIAVLGTVVAVVINPAESLRKTRDTQRVHDLDALAGALKLYLSDAVLPSLGGSVANFCLETGNTSARIGYSVPPTGESCVDTILGGVEKAAGSGFHSGGYCRYSAVPEALDGNGWIPINFTSMSGGSPLKKLPVDPVNTLRFAMPQQSDLVYRYACQSATVASTEKANVFELDAQFESKQYTVITDLRASDGGDNDGYYETGTSLKLIGAGTNF